ncbi:hypothetical protein L8W69_06415 [Campylobacter sp. CNRCH_2016_3089]|uniref:hypothetical protein n=1 Tax=Campylobacter sp. CNRCH_2016_3089 TaxID=2911609 RepID=UPI0021E62AEA|nr:hypothetical protein [Campylobacter sp. CNRCH_2016_3089]MCV3508850.1 hypothetical protein [Campylobacter sp. CNRCH_2016_3089]
MDNNFSYEEIIAQLNKCAEKKLKKELLKYKSKDYFIEYLKEIYFSIPAKPRKVFISKEIKERILDKKIRKAVNKIEYKLKKGEDVNPLLSKRFDNNDKMLSSFGIHHFHLGEYLKNKQEYNRTRELLYCFLPYYNDNLIYFIDILPHKQWCNQELFNIIQKNWPDVIDYIKSPLETDILYTDKNIKDLRDVNINIMPCLKTGEILMPNFGYAIDGNPINVYHCVIQIKKQIKLVYKKNHIDIHDMEIIDFKISNSLILEKIIIKSKTSGNENVYFFNQYPINLLYPSQPS